MTGKTMVLPIALEVRLHREEAVPHARRYEDAFNPEEARDPHGEWTSGSDLSPEHLAWLEKIGVVHKIPGHDPQTDTPAFKAWSVPL
jgi:hypothetical protein